jgi:hypothetical protein
MDVHLIDGTYELFRHFDAVPATADGEWAGNRRSHTLKDNATRYGIARSVRPRNVGKNSERRYTDCAGRVTWAHPGLRRRQKCGLAFYTLIWIAYWLFMRLVRSAHSPKT